MKKQVKLIYSKKEKDLLFSYPDNADKSLMGIFFDMCTITGHRMDWGQTLKEALESRGYDYTSLKITCDKKTID